MMAAKAALVGGGLAVLLLLAACGGGGGDNPNPNPNPNPGPGPGPAAEFTLAGVIRTPSNAPLPNVRLLLGSRTQTTGADGAYSFDHLPEGGYTLTLQDAASGSFDCRSLVVAAGQTHYDFILPSQLSGFRVERVEPLLGSVGLPLSEPFVLECNGTVDPSSVDAADFHITPSIGDFTVAASGAGITLNPVLQLAPALNLTVEMTGDIRNTSGDSLARPVRWSFRTASTDVYPPQPTGVQPVDGSTQVALNQPLRFSYDEALAPDTQQLQLGVMATPSTVLTWHVSGRELIVTPTSGWTPSTAYVVNVHDLADSNGNVTHLAGTVSFTTGAQQLITHNLQGEWNRVSNQIVFASDRDGASGFDIWSIKPDGTALTQLTSLPGDEFEPTLSEDGSRLAFQKAGANGKTDIYTASIADGVAGVPQAITPPDFNDSQPQFSRTPSNLLVFVSDRGARTGLYTMNEDGSSPVEMDPDFGQASAQPAFHPLLDGQYLFSAVTGDKRDVWRKSVSIIDGSTVNTDLTSGRLSDDYSPAWGPDASFIVFISDFDGIPNLWQAEANGDFPRQVTTFSSPVDDPTVSPVAGDNTCLLTIQRADGGSDLVLVSLISGAIQRNLTSEDGPQP